MYQKINLISEKITSYIASELLIIVCYQPECERYPLRRKKIVCQPACRFGIEGLTRFTNFYILFQDATLYVMLLCNPILGVGLAYAQNWVS